MKNLLLLATIFFVFFTFNSCNQSQQDGIPSPTINSEDSSSPKRINWRNWPPMVSKSSNNEADLMMKIINNEIKTPMDSAMSKKCFDFMKTNYSLMNKILNNPISSKKEMAEIAMVNYLICVNSIELLEKSKLVLTIYMKNELETYKNNVELVSPRILDMTKSFQ
jgi:hypothetical protein